MKVLIYSHDSYGLGHLRRCRAIAHALVARFAQVEVCILTGSTVAGRFSFRERVRCVRLPPVTKLPSGEYAPGNAAAGLASTIALRAAVIRRTAGRFRPDVFIVDKEPTGLCGELAALLPRLKARGTQLVLGLRDVIDDPAVLRAEWARKGALPVLRDLYDEIWVYGLRALYDPLAGLALPAAVQCKVRYLGYLRRETPAAAPAGEPYLLGTPGGGGDGDALVDWLLGAYEEDLSLPHPLLLVLGPLMHEESRARFHRRAGRLARVRVLDFHPSLDALMAGAAGVIAMGGYNTFCEILSLDQRALLVPRTAPRLEQHIRALHASRRGLAGMLSAAGPREPGIMAAALRGLAGQPRPSRAAPPGLLDGLDNLAAALASRLDRSAVA